MVEEVYYRSFTIHIFSRLLALLLWPMACLGQTVTPTIAAGTQLCTVPKNGGACRVPTTINLPPVTLPPPSIKGITGTFTCTVSASSTVITNPDGTKTITGVVCSVVTK